MFKSVHVYAPLRSCREEHLESRVTLIVKLMKCHCTCCRALVWDTRRTQCAVSAAANAIDCADDSQEISVLKEEAAFAIVRPDIDGMHARMHVRADDSERERTRAHTV